MSLLDLTCGLNIGVWSKSSRGETWRFLGTMRLSGWERVDSFLSLSNTSPRHFEDDCERNVLYLHACLDRKIGTSIP